MKLKTRKFGEIEFPEEKIITFEKGLFGFEKLKKYLFIKPDDSLFYWINAIDNPDVAFPMFGMRVIDEHYPQEESFESFGIVILNADPSKITINLKAPVYINQDEKKGFQRILDSDKYQIDYNLFTE